MYFNVTDRRTDVLPHSNTMFSAALCSNAACLAVAQTTETHHSYSECL